MKSRLIALILVWFSLSPLGHSANAKEPLEHTKADQDLENHILSADADGWARLPARECAHARGGYYLSTNELTAYLNAILVRADKWASNRQATLHVDTNITRLLIYVHGGLNEFQNTARRVRQLAPVMMADGTNGQYPLFLAWPSDAQSCIGQRVTEIRQGVHEKAFLNGLSAPIVTAVDLARVPATLPVEWWNQLLNLRDRSGPTRSMAAKSRLAQSGIRELGKIGSEFMVESSDYVGGFMEEPFANIGQTLLTPIRVSIGTLGHGAIGQESWRVMKRRTTSIFFPPQTIQVLPEEPVISERVAAGYLFKWLATQIHARSKNSESRKLEITLAGHSMGTIVLNKALARYQSDLLTGNALKRVVYMAAACSVNDARESLLPLLEASERMHPANSVKFYNLTLNRVAEVAEPTAKGFAPYGSLLEWIDQHLENPETILDRTLGSELNVWACLSIFSSVHRQCTFKSFDRYPDMIPTTHGDFNDCPYWRPEFWAVAQGRKKHIVPSDPLAGTPGGKWVNCYPDNWLAPDKTGKVDPIAALNRLEAIIRGEAIKDPKLHPGVSGQPKKPSGANFPGQAPNTK